MKKIYFIIILLLSFKAFSQNKWNSNFDKKEALNMLALCNYWLNGKIKNVDSTHIDNNYKLLYESKHYPWDNEWQLWKKDSDAIVINIRGTTRKNISWMENFYAAMISATGDITRPDSQKIHYQLAQDPRAFVHVGWTIGLSYLLPDILEKIKKYNQKGIYKIYITGHSQGGALAHLLQAYLHYAPSQIISPQNEYKIYAFASPKPGNSYFALDYASYTNIQSNTFTIINSKDWVPQMPFSIQAARNIKTPNPFYSLEENQFKMPLLKRWFFKNSYRYLNKPSILAQRRYIKVLGKKMRKQMQKQTKGFVNPDFQKDFSYVQVGIILPLSPIKTQSKNILMNLFWQHLPAHYYQLVQKEY